MKNALWKSIWREIRVSITRYLSIMGMVAIGVFVLVGLMAATPMMREYGIDRIKKENLQDLTVESTFGLNEEDQELLSNQDWISQIEYGYTRDLKTKNDELLRLLSYPEVIGMPKILEGHAPESNAEILVDTDMKKYGYQLGDHITFLKESDKFKMEDEDKDDLKRYSFRIVGFAESLDFTDQIQKGTSLIGPGKLTGFAYVSPRVFNLQDYTTAKLIGSGAKDGSLIGDNYHSYIALMKDDLKAAFDPVKKNRFAEVKKDITDAINDGDQEIADAYKELGDGQAKIDDAKAELAKGETEYADGLARYNREIADAKKKIDDSEKELADAKVELDDAKVELEDGRKELEDGRRKLNDGIAEYEDGRQKYLDGLKKYQDGKAEIADGWKAYYAGLDELEVNRKKLADGWSQFEAGKMKLAAAKAQLDANKPKVDEAKAIIAGLEAKKSGLESTLKELEKQQSELETNVDQLNTAIAGLDSQIIVLKTQLKKPNLTPDEEEAIKGEIAALQGQVSGLQGQLSTAQKGLVLLKDGIKEAQGGIGQIDDGILQAQKGIDQYNQGLAEYEAGLAKLNQSRKELESGQAQLLAGEKELEQAKQDLEAGELELAKSKPELDQAAIDVEKGRAEVEKAKAEFADAEAEFNKGEQEYLNGQAKYRDGVEKLADAKATFTREKAKGWQELLDARRELSDGYADLAKGEAEFEEEKADALIKIADAQKDLDSARDTLRRIKAPQYTFTSYLDTPLFNFFDNAGRIVFLSFIFPTFLFLIAMLVSLTTMTRMVDEQRTQMGTLKALGYNSSDVAKKFLIYGGSASAMGGILGIIGGHLILAPMIIRAYEASTIMSQVPLSFYPGIALLAFVLGLASTAGTAYLVVKNSMRQTAATLMRPKAPKVGTRIFLEYIRPFWRKLTFMQKVTARNIFRYKKRLFMTLFGIMGCTGLLFMGFAIRQAVSEVIQTQYIEITKFDLISIYDKDYGDKALKDYMDLVNHDKRIDHYADIVYRTLLTDNPKGQEQQANLIVPMDRESFHQYVQLRDRRSQNPIALEDDGVVITEKLAKLKGLKAGDTIVLEDRDAIRYEARITDIAETYAGHFIFATPKAYETIFGKAAEPNAHVIEFISHGHEDNKDLINDILDLDAVLAIVDFTYLQDVTAKFLDSMNVIVYIIVSLSMLLAVIVLYNLTNINISERLRELSTIKVLGFYNEELTSYVYREIWVITLFAIILGFGAGLALHQGIINLTPPDSAMFNPLPTWHPYAYSALITLGITLVVQKIVTKKLKKINMVEALKSVE